MGAAAPKSCTCTAIISACSIGFGWKPFWLDTLAIGEQVERIAFVADNPGKWLLESRVLDSRASPSAVWFAVT